VEFHPECETWANSLGANDLEDLLAAIRLLQDRGPGLGRPLVDSIVQSKHSNMKELRPGSTGRTEIRLLFAFDLERVAILLIGGDKAGRWKDWYTVNIPIADQRFELHQSAIREAREKEQKQQIAKGRGKGK
jgi:hypothetical protein